MNGPSEYGSVQHSFSRAAEYSPYTPAAPLVEPTILSTKEQRKPISPRPQRKVELLNGQILSFSDIADFYSDSLPISARVYGGGFYGTGGELTIAENETLYIHAVLKADVAKAEVSHNRKYNIPLTFSVPFGIVFNPSNSVTEAMEGYFFESIDSILSGKELPKIVRLECNTIDTSGYVVNCGDILIVKGSPAPKQLNVYNISTGTISTLFKGSFSTKPNHIKMSLVQIHQFAHDLLPCQVTLCCEDCSSVNAPAHLVSSILTIKEFKSCTRILVTSKLDSNVSSLNVMELPGDLQFQVQTTVTETWQPLAKTAAMISELYPKLPSLHRYLGMPNEKMRQGQLFFYETGICTSIENDHSDSVRENEYVEVIRPTVPLSLAHSMSESHNDYKSKQQGKDLLTPADDYITIVQSTPLFQELNSQENHSSRPVPQPKKRTLLNTSNNSVPHMIPLAGSGQVPPIQGSSIQAFSAAPKIIPRPRPHSHLKGEVLALVPDISSSVLESSTSAAPPVKTQIQTSTDPADQVTQLTLELLRLKQEWADIKCKINGAMEMIHQFCDKSGISVKERRPQSNLGVDEVIALLQAAGLEQYETVFRTELIDGDIFCELDEQTLEKELAVTSKLHRLRFLKLIRDQRLLQIHF